MFSMKMLVLCGSIKSQETGKKKKKKMSVTEQSIPVYPVQRQLTPLSDFGTSSEKHKTVMTNEAVDIS